MANIRDITGKNRRFTGTDGIKLPEGTTAQRPGSPADGELRFNTTLNLAEYYDGTNWKAIDAPPTISGFAVDGGSVGTTGVVDPGGGGTVSIVISGSLFDTTAGVVTFVPEGTGSTVNTASITRTSASSFTVTATESDFSEAGDPYAIKLVNGSGLSATLAGAIDCNVAPTFATAADTDVGSIAQGGSDYSGFTTVAATDADGDAITHTISAGSLPSGTSLSTAGTFSGTVSGGATIQQYTFTVQAATANHTVTRQFKMTVAAAAGDAEYNSGGTYSWTVPAGVTSVSVVCIGAGGTNGIGNSGQAGGGGALAYRNAITVVPGATGTVVVGASSGRSGNQGQTGGSSSFQYSGTTTTAGGGGGGYGDGLQNAGTGGGSGGTRSGTTTGGGNGGAGGTDGQNAGGPGGGGAGGYSGNGGAGATGFAPTSSTNGSAGSGGGGGGGGKGGTNEAGGGGGGGVGFYGEGTSGAGGTGSGQNNNGGGGAAGGSGGQAGGTGENSVAGGQNSSGGQGGAYGGGQGGTQSEGSNNSAGVGAVRIVWDPAGTAPAFPSTNVADR
jgi:hypothetical protein